MNKQTYLSLTGAIFLIIGLMHLLRLYFGWQVSFNGWSAPLWLSAVLAAVAFALSWLGLKFGRE